MGVSNQFRDNRPSVTADLKTILPTVAKSLAMVAGIAVLNGTNTGMGLLAGAALMFGSAYVAYKGFDTNVGDAFSRLWVRAHEKKPVSVSKSRDPCCPPRPV